MCALAIVTALAFALYSVDNAHPDEIYHADAFAYYEGKFWPPDLNADGLVYSKGGWSYVYTGDIGYRAFGNLGFVLKKVFPFRSAFTLYRLLNVALFIATLLFMVRQRPPHLDNVLFCAFALGFPQFMYLYTYCNTDAFGLSCAIFLFYHGLKLYDTSFVSWRLRDVGLLALGVGLLLASKQNFILACLSPAVLLVSKAFREWDFLRSNRRQAFLWAGCVVVGAVLVAGPLKILYPILQGDNREKMTRMFESRAIEDFKPSKMALSASNPKPKHGVRLVDRGYGVFDILGLKWWGKSYLEMLVESFWGVFGWMTVYAPRVVYLTAFALLFVTALLNARPSLSRRQGAAPGNRALYLSSALTAALGVASVLWYSLYVDVQAQGRYLYPAFASILILICGSLRREAGLSGKTAEFACALLFCLSQYTLWSGLPSLR